MNNILFIVSLGTLTTSLLPMNLSLHNQAPRSEADQTLLNAFVDNDMEMMKFALQELNAQVDMTNKDGITLLEQAMKKSNLFMVSFLVGYGAKITDNIKTLAEKDARLKNILQITTQQPSITTTAPRPQESAAANNSKNINAVNNVVVQPTNKKITAQEYINERNAWMKTEEPQQQIDNLVAGFLGNNIPTEKKEQEEKKQAAMSEPSLYFTPEDQEQADQSLRLAAFRNDFAMVETALSLGADINAGDASGTTALMNAVHASPEMVKKLIINGAAVDKTNAKGYTAFDYAAKWFVSSANKNENISWRLAKIITTLVSYDANYQGKDYSNAPFNNAIERGKKFLQDTTKEVIAITEKNNELMKKTLAKEEQRRLQIAEMKRFEMEKHERELREKLNKPIEPKALSLTPDDILQSQQDTRISANSDNTNWYGDRYAIHRRLRDLSYAKDPQSTLPLIKLIEECGQDKSIFEDAHPIFFLLEVGRIDVVEKLLAGHFFDIHTLNHEKTILDHAILSYSVPDHVVAMLVNYGARLNTHSSYFDLVLHHLKRRSFAIQELVLHQLTPSEKNKIKKIVMDAGYCRYVAQMIVDYC